MTKPTSEQRNWNRWGEKDPMWAVATIGDNEGGRWDPDEFFELGRSEIAEVMKEIDGLDGDFPRGKALDFGCGVGKMVQALAAYFDEVVGVDLAPSMVAEARKYNKLGDRCRFQVNDSYDLSAFEDNSFDMTFSRAVLQHIRPPFIKAYVREFVRITRPGGLVVFQVHAEPMRAPATLRERIKAKLPAELLWKYWDLKYRLGYAIMELHGIPKPEMIALLESWGTKVLRVYPDRKASGAWNTHMYIAVKR